jgi:quinol monooxygenase YgiN
MYGTIGKWRVKAGHMDAFLALLNTWQGPEGFISMTVYHSTDDPNVVLAAVAFASRDAYHANAQSESQHTFYNQTLQHLEGEPEWTDGDIVATLGG